MSASGDVFYPVGHAPCRPKGGPCSVMTASPARRRHSSPSGVRSTGYQSACAPIDWITQLFFNVIKKLRRDIRKNGW